MSDFSLSCESMKTSYIYIYWKTAHLLKARDIIKAGSFHLLNLKPWFIKVNMSRAHVTSKLRASAKPDNRQDASGFLRPAAGLSSSSVGGLERETDLHKLVVRNEAATFFVRACGDSMSEAGIMDNDILVADRSFIPQPGQIVIASVDGVLMVKYLRKSRGKTLLVPANPDYATLDVTGRKDFSVIGVVTHAVRSFV